MSSGPKLQDLPPSGGYKPITFDRVPAKTYFSGRTLILGYIASFGASSYLYWLNYKKVKTEELEVRSANMALLPLLMAERDRAYLRYLRSNRDEEAELMKNVDGWVVGTYYGEPLYKTQGDDYLAHQNQETFYAHCSKWYYDIRATFKFIT